MKYPKPNDSPITNEIHLLFLLFATSKKNNEGKVIKLTKKILTGGKLKEEMIPKAKGIKINDNLF